MSPPFVAAQRAVVRVAFVAAFGWLSVPALEAQAVVNAGPSTAATPQLAQVRRAQLAGRQLANFPWFDHANVLFAGNAVFLGFDPTGFDDLLGQTVDAYVVFHRTPEVYAVNPVLTDVIGSPQALTVSVGGIRSNTLFYSSLLNGNAGLGLGVAYDVVLDVNRNGVLDGGDVIDGFSQEAGFYVCDPTGVPGPLAVTEVLYNGGTFLGEDIYFPTDVANLGQLPLVVVSHGNGHNYTWYDHIGNHLASWGCIVMSHQNNTMPGIETASTTTLTNTDHFLGNLATIAGGQLAGHVDSHRIVWMGHSRGGEGVARAYDRIFDGTFTPANYTLADIKLVSSIAPTDFLGTASANPHGANYHLWVGGADADVTGCASSDIAMSYPLLKRATGTQQSIELHGAGHGAFHDGGGSTVSTGPCLLTRADVHAIMKAYLLPLVKRYTEGNVPAKDFLWRQWESFQSPGVPTNSCVVVDLQYEDAPGVDRRVIDDFQTNNATNLSSSGGAVTFDVSSLAEARLDDVNGDFNFGVADLFNGMTEGTAADATRGLVFQWSADRFVDFEVTPALSDVRDFEFLSFRACQCTRASETTAVLGDLDFTLVLVDGAGQTSSIRLSTYGGGIEEPYQRNSCGAVGVGWNNEWETVRVRVKDFARDGTLIDLSNIAHVQLRVGPSNGSSVGRIGFDDLEFTRN